MCEYRMFKLAKLDNYKKVTFPSTVRKRESKSCIAVCRGIVVQTRCADVKPIVRHNKRESERKRKGEGEEVVNSGPKLKIYSIIQIFVE